MTSAHLPSIADLELLAARRARIVGLAELLGSDELAVLELVGEGLARGRSVYGELIVDRDRRDFQAEAGAELRDSLVYIAAELVRLRRSGGTS